MIRFLTALFICISFAFSAQAQMIRGRILDNSNQKPVSNATLNVSGKEDYIVVSDSAGYYFLELPPGIYNLMIQAPDYKVQLREGVALFSGKQEVQDFELNELTLSLDTVTVASERSPEHIEINKTNIQKEAAVFYDPARVVTLHSGLINTDDQANTISVRGTSPTYLQWKIEGVEVVNPNHLENAGTMNDRPSLNSGGVSLISAQMLERSVFNLPTFDAASGNALSGMFDIKLRKGNDERKERIVQASLLGTDLCLEGPFTKKSKISYLINLRYSTIGILSKMGINFGGEKTDYKDASYQLSFPTRKGSLKLFGVVGSSETNFKGKNDSSEVEIEKDLMTIDYTSFTTINGLSFINSIGNNAHFKTTIAFSDKTVERIAGPSSEKWKTLDSEKDLFKQQKLSSLTYISYRLNNSSRIKAGTYANYFVNELAGSVNDIYHTLGKIEDPLFEPFISAEASFKNWDIKGGLHSLYQTRINYFQFQPRFSVTYNINDDQFLSFNYGLTSQIQPVSLSLNNSKLKPTELNNFSICHFIKIKNNTLKSEAFLQFYNNIPVNPMNGFSAFNYFNERITFSLNEGGKARVYGIDATFTRNYRALYTSLSGSLFNSAYSLNTDKYYSSRYNTGYNVMLAAGKEFKLKNKKKSIDINIRSMIRNGFLAHADVLATDYSYTYQLPVYSRTDLRISFTKDNLRSTYIWALDIQNVANQKNVAYYYFDRFTKQTETRYQLGIIPVLSFKVLF